MTATLTGIYICLVVLVFDVTLAVTVYILRGSKK